MAAISETQTTTFSNLILASGVGKGPAKFVEQLAQMMLAQMVVEAVVQFKLVEVLGHSWKWLLRFVGTFAQDCRYGGSSLWKRLFKLEMMHQ